MPSHSINCAPMRFDRLDADLHRKCDLFSAFVIGDQLHDLALPER